MLIYPFLLEETLRLWELGFNTIGESGSVVPRAHLNQSKQKFEESHLLTISVNKTTYRIRPFFRVFAEDILSKR